MVYTHNMYQDNAGIYMPKAKYFYILTTCENMLAQYFELFL